MPRRRVGAWFVLMALLFSQIGLSATPPSSEGGSPSPLPGGGGGGSGAPGVFPVLRGNPRGVDAVAEPSPSPSPAGGGGGGTPEGPFIRVIPGGTEAREASRPPSP